MNVFEISTLAIQATGLIFVSLSIVYAAKSFRANTYKNEYDKRLETIKYIHQLNETIKDSIFILNKVTKPWEPIPLEVIEGDQEIQFHINNLLTSLDFMSVAANTGVYDGAMLERSIGNLPIQAFNKGRQFIEDQRKYRSAHLFIELEAFALRIENKQKKSLTIASTRTA